MKTPVQGSVAILESAQVTFMKRTKSQQTWKKTTEVQYSEKSALQMFHEDGNAFKTLICQISKYTLCV